MEKKLRTRLLQLSRETIHPLENDKLVHIGGGCYTTSWPTEAVVPTGTDH
jgi:hypothetical protein